MTDETITRARAAVARLREAEAGATPGPWAAGWNGGPDAEGLDAAGPIHIVALNRGGVADLAPNPYGDAKTWERVVANASAIASLRNAAPYLLALAEAVGRMAEGKRKSAPWWSVLWWNDGGYDICAGCLEPTYKKHAPDCPALAIDAALAALADLAALAGDADAGEVG